MSNYWQRKQNFRTYELTPELIQKIDVTSQELDVYQSELVRCLLSDAFKRLESGKLTLKPIPRAVKHRLHHLG